VSAAAVTDLGDCVHGQPVGSRCEGCGGVARQVSVREALRYGLRVRVAGERE
jgi:bacterioferritin-associated ferredoxin